MSSEDRALRKECTLSECLPGECCNHTEEDTFLCYFSVGRVILPVLSRCSCPGAAVTPSTARAAQGRGEFSAQRRGPQA